MGLDAAIQSYVADAVQLPVVRIAARFAAGLEVGDQLASFCLLLIMAGYVAQKPRWVKTFAGALVSLAAAGIAVQILKYLIGRARPAMELGDLTFIGPHFSPSGFDSFPSGHTTAMFALLAFFCRFYPGGTIPLYIAGLALSIFARVFTGQHFFTDVIGGTVLGSMIGILIAVRLRGFVESPPAATPLRTEEAGTEALPSPYGSALADMSSVVLFSAVLLFIGSGVDVNSAILGVLTAFATYFLARQMTGKDTALYAALVFASCLLFVHVARTWTVDTAWLFFTTLAFTYYAYAVARGRRSYILLSLAYGAMGLGVLAKGWPALWPVPVFGLYEYLRDKPSFAEFARRTLAPHAVLLALVALATFRWLGYGLFVSSAGVGANFVFDDVVAKTGLTRHAGRIIYYLPVLAAAVFPWSFFAIAHFVAEGRRWSRSPQLTSESLLLFLWAAVVLGVFPFVAPRSPHYLVLALPPLVCLLAGFFRRDLITSPAALRFSLLATIFTAAAFVVAGIVLHRLRPQYGSLKLAAPFAVLTFFAVTAWLLRHRQAGSGFFMPLCLGALAFYLSAIAIAFSS
jgi:membrane-associated phospholipid phosphatase